MATQEREPLELKIINAPPELDFYFAHARGKSISLTIQALNGATKDLEVWIDCLNVPSKHAEKGKRGEWEIRGRFYGNGRDSDQRFPYGYDRELITHEYALWGEFTAVYNKRNRKGTVKTYNYKDIELRRPIKVSW